MRALKRNTDSLPLCVKIVLKKKSKNVAPFFAPKAQKKEQRPKSTPFERSKKQCVFHFNARM
jgi:hypothetical protein